MKFIGSIPSNSRAILGKILSGVDKNAEIVVGTSGGFSVESLLIGLGFKNIYSNDISLLTSSFGRGAVGEMIKISIENDFFAPLKEFENRSIEDNIAIVLTIYQASEYVTFPAMQRKMSFDYMREYLLEFFKKNKEVAEKELKKIKIKGFIGRDLVALIDDEDFCRGKIIVASIPTYAGGYEKIYSFLEKSLKWNAPAYTLIDRQNYEEINQRIVDLGGIAFLDRESGVSHLKGVAYGAGKPIYIHSKINDEKYFLKDVKRQRFGRFEFFDDDFRSVEKVEVLPIGGAEFNLMRECKISLKNIILGAVEFPFVVLLDGKAIGLIGIEVPKLKFGKESAIHLKTDLTFINRGRVSKLMPMLVCSVEMQRILEQKRLRKTEYELIFTSVVTNKPVSMKYRGIGEIFSKKDDGGGWRH